MPATTNGTAYTTYETTLTDANQVLYGVADSHKTDTGIPVILYAHGNGGSYQQFAGSGAFKGLRDWLMDNGWAWVESTGGGGDSWGNQQARDHYEAAYTWLTTQINVGPVVVLGRSMGGIVSYWLHTRSAVVPSAALIANSAVTDLQAWIGPSPGYPVFRTAFGIEEDGSNYEAVLNEHDPMRQPLTDWIGQKVIQLWGDADTTVPPAVHAEAWISKYGSELALMRTDIREGGDHSQTNGSYLETDAMVSFMAETTGRGPLEPVGPAELYRILSMYQIGADLKLYEATPGA